MPMFDLKCPQCGHVCERLVKYEELKLQKCAQPNCGATLERQHTVNPKAYGFRFNFFEES